jgi:DNA-binding response OmpR family regulator
MTALSGINSRVAGYEHGADAYMVKPVDTRELMAATLQAGRRSVLTRQPGPELLLDTAALRLRGPEGITPISERETQLLVAFVLAVGQQLDNWQVFQVLGIAEDQKEKNRAMVAITRLRAKLNRVSSKDDCLRVIRHTGYRLCIPVRLV